MVLWLQDWRVIVVDEEELIYGRFDSQIRTVNYLFLTSKKDSLTEFSFFGSTQANIKIHKASLKVIEPNDQFKVIIKLINPSAKYDIWYANSPCISYYFSYAPIDEISEIFPINRLEDLYYENDKLEIPILANERLNYITSFYNNSATNEDRFEIDSLFIQEMIHQALE